MTVAIRRGGGDRGGRWRGHVLALPAGRWRDALGQATFTGTEVALGDLLTERPVALLVPQVEP